MRERKIWVYYGRRGKGELGRCGNGVHSINQRGRVSTNTVVVEQSLYRAERCKGDLREELKSAHTLPGRVRGGQKKDPRLCPKGTFALHA